MNESETREALVRAFVAAIEPGESPLPHHLADVALEVFRRATAKPACATTWRGDLIRGDSEES